MTESQASSRMWLGRIGGLRTEVIMRCFGMMLCLSVLGRMNRRSIVEFLDDYPPSLAVLGVCGFLLLFGGPRLIVLLPCSLAGWDFIWRVCQGIGGRGLTMQAAEYPLFPGVPTAVVVLVCVNVYFGKSDRDWESVQTELDSLLIRFFRWIAVTTLVWVSFHKLNWDFLNYSRSCEKVLRAKIPQRWSGDILPWLGSFSTPMRVILMEGPIAIGLLLFARRLGILFVCLLFSMVSFVNAIVVTLAVIVPSFSFLPASDESSVRNGWKTVLAIWAVVMGVVLPLSHSSFHGDRQWYLHAIHHCMVLGFIVIACYCQCLAWRKSRSESVDLLRGAIAGLGQRAGFFVHNRFSNTALCLIAVVCILNGISPYLGLKFEYSFAMLSNLRVDDARWNHVLVPKWVRLTAHDAFVHVYRFESVPPQGRRAPVVKEGDLHPALYSPWIVAERINRMVKKQPDTIVHAEFEFDGRKFEFDGYPGDKALQEFIAKFPKKNRLFQDELVLNGPQRCVH